MTTFTIDAPVHLSKTHFRNISEAATFFIQWQFEEQLGNQTKRAMTIPEDQLMDF